MTKSIVTGGAGFIGSHVVDLLLGDGHKVIVIDNESSDAHDNFYWNDKSENHILDICNYDAIEPLFEGVDFVFHLAAEARIMNTIENPRKAVEVNTLGTCNILQAAKIHGVKRVMYSSTSAAYGLINEPPHVETMPVDSLNPYTASKVAGEELCKMYSKLFGVETVIFRYFNVYGERCPKKGQYAPVIGVFQRQMAEGRDMTIVGDGLQSRDFVHVKDVANANIKAALCENKDVVGSIFNIGTGSKYSVLDIAKMLGGKYVHISARPGEAQVTLADITKARNMLQWDSTIKLEDWIEENK